MGGAQPGRVAWLREVKLGPLRVIEARRVRAKTNFHSPSSVSELDGRISSPVSWR